MKKIPTEIEDCWECPFRRMAPGDGKVIRCAIIDAYFSSPEVAMKYCPLDDKEEKRNGKKKN